ncbi:MAG: type II toxin-antitoxin system prevent-host-death family antitoxin [Deltaproteobacteria bacterium]|nr:type II toxin-antitoxin system prevent-host-death family antitoxin [Deltaproteobacteria bacterium]
MTTVGIRELKESVSDILRRVRERDETIEISYRGEVVARIVPVRRERSQAGARRRARAVWNDIDRVADEISARWPRGVGAVRAIRETRRG